jgi:hypothetical protein
MSATEQTNIDPGTSLAEYGSSRLIVLQVSLCDIRDVYHAHERASLQTALLDSDGNVTISELGGASITLSESAFETLLEAHRAHVESQRRNVATPSGDEFDPFLDADDLPQRRVAMRSQRFISKEEIPEWAQLQTSLSTHLIIEDEHGIYRYEQNKLVNWLWESGNLDLNAMRVAYVHGAFSRDEYMQFYRDMGYSLSGFEEVFDDELNAIEEEIEQK